tara:strand:- start:2334 stop:2600 length:267 start_codon:yes stop_codon:yes gene_type:complete
MAKSKRKVRILLDGEKQDFTIVGKTKKGTLKVHQNEGLFTSEFVEAVRKLGRWPREGEELGDNTAGTPCFIDADGQVVPRGPQKVAVT